MKILLVLEVLSLLAGKQWANPSLSYSSLCERREATLSRKEPIYCVPRLRLTLNVVLTKKNIYSTARGCQVFFYFFLLFSQNGRMSSRRL